MGKVTSYSAATSVADTDKFFLAVDAGGGSYYDRTLTGQLGRRQIGGVSTIASTDPTTSDDASLGYRPGSLWFNDSSGSLFVCEDSTNSAAVWTAISSSSGGGPVTINSQSGTLYTLALSDADNVMVITTGADPVTVRIPRTSDVAFPIGTTIALAQTGSGVLTITQQYNTTYINGLTSYSKAMIAQYATASLLKYADDYWLVSGQVA